MQRLRKTFQLFVKPERASNPAHRPDELRLQEVPKTISTLDDLEEALAQVRRRNVRAGLDVEPGLGFDGRLGQLSGELPNGSVGSGGVSGGIRNLCF